MNGMCEQGDGLFISLELLQDTQTGEMQRTPHVCFTASHTRESQGRNEVLQPQPKPVPITLPPGWVQLSLTVQGLCSLGTATHSGLCAEPISWPFQVSME